MGHYLQPNGTEAAGMQKILGCLEHCGAKAAAPKTRTDRDIENPRLLRAGEEVCLSPNPAVAGVLPADLCDQYGVSLGIGVCVALKKPLVVQPEKGFVYAVGRRDGVTKRAKVQRDKRLRVPGVIVQADGKGIAHGSRD